jgi:cyclophilin family peptidyl-prolyl cis-trans isomerase
MFEKKIFVALLILSIVTFLCVNAKKTKEVKEVKVTKKEEEVKLVDCETTKGSFRIEVHPDWSPLGADRFLDLVEDGFFTDIAFFRSVKGFLTQFGISDKPEMQHWHVDNIEDDPNLHMKMEKNYVSFAGNGKNSRNTQIFIAYQYSNFLGNEPWETPFGELSLTMLSF